MPISRLRLAFVPMLLLAIAGCDNVGRVWDPDVTPPPAPEPSASAVQIVPVGGDVREGRPKVRAAHPKDSGWPSTVPIVVEFSESINEASILPSTTGGIDGRVVLRVRGATQVLPCQYDVLASGRLLVLRPVTVLTNEQNPTYEVVLLPEARDADGVRFEVPSGGTVLTEFQVNEDPALTDGHILALYPRDNVRDVARETDYFIIFDRPANAATLVAANITVSRDGGAPLAGQLVPPLLTVGQPDPRAVRFEPDVPLEASAEYELVVTEDITFGQDGQLDFNGRTPFARFETVAPAAPSAVELGNPTPGFDDKINIDNLPTVALRITPPADAVAGETVRARVYGLDKTTTTAGDFVFVERTVELTQSGAVPVTVDFSGALGTPTSPQFEDGDITFAVQMQRGSQTSSFIHNAAGADLRFDVTRPTLVSAGPPGSLDGADIWSDTEYIAFHGFASEGLSEASLTDGVSALPAGLFASNDTGRFVMTPLLSPRSVAPRGYTLTFRDRAGNFIAGPVTGNIVQRGIVTGVFGGTLTIEAYDQGTLEPVVGATVLVDPGTPVVPALGQLFATTGVNGRAEFPGLAAGPYTVTIARSGYDLVTLYRTGAAFASLPLRPQVNATSTLQGTATFVPTPGTTVVVGNTAFDDHSPLGVRTLPGSQTTIPDTPIVPGRMQVVTAFAGVFEPTASPTFSAQGYQMLGADLMTPTLPGAPAEPGAVSRQNLSLLPSTGGITQLVSSFLVNFGVAAGLDTANLVGGRPTTRVNASLNGFDGQALFGIGFANVSAGTTYAIDANFGLPASGYIAFGPTFWVVTEARDAAGNTTRHRALLDGGTGNVLVVPDPLSIPVASSPGGTGSPLVTVVDVLDESVAGGAGEAVVDLTATDANGRRWVVLASDRDGLGTPESIQLPDLASLNVTGLSPGAWNLRAEARLWISVTLANADDWVLTERTRVEALYARSAPTAITVN